jgi:hypothetical protein
MTERTMSTDARLGPGEYVPDPTEAVVSGEQLPLPLIEVMDREARSAPCPHCGRMAPRLCRKHRTLHDLGDARAGRPRDLDVRYAQFHCVCGGYFSTDLGDLGAVHGHYTHRVVQAAVRLVVEDKLPYRTASWHLWRAQRVFVPFATIQNWVEAAGEKGDGASGAGLSGRGVGVLQWTGRH